MKAQDVEVTRTIQNHNNPSLYEEATQEFQSLALVGVNLALDLVDEYLMRTMKTYECDH